MAFHYKKRTVRNGDNATYFGKMMTSRRNPTLYQKFVRWHLFVAGIALIPKVKLFSSPKEDTIPTMSACIHARVTCIRVLLLCRVSNQNIKTGKHRCGQASECCWSNIIPNLRGLGAGWKGGKGKLWVSVSTCLNVKGHAEIKFKLPAFVKFLPRFKLSLLGCNYQ